MNLAPIVLFVYNRPWHTKQTVEALQKNELAKESELFIYCDEAKNEDAGKSVDEVREYIDKVDGFKKVTIIKREKNWGLADSIIDGVTKIVNEYGKIIVLEDDMVTSPYFLKFMNEALEFYKDEEKVWHISGWNYPIDTDGLDDVFLWRLMNCWGWATWTDRWNKTDWKVTDFQILLQDKKKQKKYNYSGDDKFAMLSDQMEGFIDSWAIRWDYCHFQNQAVCVYPIHSLVNNIGHDGSGVHSSKVNFGALVNDLSQSKGELGFSPYMGINEKMIERFRHVYRKGFFYQLKQIIKKLIFYNTWRARKCQEN